MCGRAGLTVPPDQVAGAVRSAGCAVPATAKPAAYRTSSAKKADADSFPCVVAAPGGVDLATLGFGVKKLRCHNAFVEGWLDRKTWREAAATPRGRCSMVVTSFVEGITARRPDDAVFFILGLRVGDEFVILTTAAKRSALLGERARAKEGWGAGRYPIVADGARAAAWATADGPEAAHRLVAELDASTLSNELGLVLGANRKRSLPSPGQKTLGAFFGSPAKKEKRARRRRWSPARRLPARTTTRAARLGGSPREDGRAERLAAAERRASSGAASSGGEAPSASAARRRPTRSRAAVHPTQRRWRAGAATACLARVRRPPRARAQGGVIDLT
ncbi:hypothetical protein SO694_00080164 [Aureococcus anophagefferens]|uniref:Abasic site processing protein n=1 Tax=Aureococcus anophagefferens TaxID=44056 RepID=A0ABR1G4P4_AURAN